ncbi:helix-turn-helix transcriptional regulator [Chelatococcus sp. XZ-Ab1]|uniref:helix-turn-helix domain-containing protein n=1 Tax=Chelatococcus sp. XZ-Ab1 TaxID=3034027 RepID=UPI0023E3EE47|nr:helix-turn-helix transcriptional regulator [Chelatococcus sp. XZ-Ab1]
MARTTTVSPVDVGERVRLLIDAMGMSATDFARLCGLTPQHINNYTSGRAMLSVTAAAAIAAATGVTFDYLYRGDRSSLPLRLVTLLSDEERRRSAS